MNEVARRFRATSEVVQLWIDLGLLQVSNAEHRPLISLPAVLEFLDHYGRPVSSHAEPPLKKILAVDDDPHILEILCGVFERDPRLRLETAESGFEGLIRFGQLKPDLVILDLHLAGMNGIDVCRRIRSVSKFLNTKVVVLTGFPQSALLPELTAIGVDRVLIKPISIDELAEVVYSLLALPGMDVTSGRFSPDTHL